MELELLRYNSAEETTHGLLSDVSCGYEFLCYTLEDQWRPHKVYGDTRIPAGDYRITLRTVGGQHAKYAQRYPHMHRGMLWLRDVPNYQYVLIHVGNYDDDTEGCILVGDTAAEGFVGNSRAAYERVYPHIADHIAGGGRATIRIIDRG